MDKGYNQKGPCQKPDHTNGCQCVPNVNIPETETIKFVRTYQKKRRSQLIKTNYGHGCSGEKKKGAAWTEMDRQQPRRYEQIRADMTENRHYWKMMVNTGPQRSGDCL